MHLAPLSRSRTALCLLVCLPLALLGQDTAGSQAFENLYQLELESNLRWQLARLRGDHERADARVGVLADSGVWHLGARSVVEALEGADVSCRVLDRSQLSAEGLAGIEVLVIPGGWAPYQLDALGEDGPGVIRDFVKRGGRYLGICAGAYLAADEVEYQGITYPYPVDLLDSAAEGPVPELPLYPEVVTIRLSATRAGRRRGIPRELVCLFQGGCTFEEDPDLTVLALYPDGSPAIVSAPFGRGEVILSGAHFERPPLEAGGLKDTPPPDGAGKLLRELLQLERD